MKLSALKRPLGKAKGMRRFARRNSWDKPGRESGVEVEDITTLDVEDQSPAVITCVDYGPKYYKCYQIDDLEAFFNDAQLPEGAEQRWINVAGLRDLNAMQAVARHFELHPLIVEDLLDVTHRPKCEEHLTFDEESGKQETAQLFVTMRMVHLLEDHVALETVSVLIAASTVITFQESHEDAWGPVRQRFETPGNRLLSSGPSFLLYSLIDLVVDSYYPTVEHVGNLMEDLEEELLEDQSVLVNPRVHSLRRELIMLRRQAWPMREIINTLMQDRQTIISKRTRSYLRDVYDHVIHIMDIIETYRDSAGNLLDMQMNKVNARMNEVMKVLTVIATIFIPLSFFASVYGMNFDYMPGLKDRYGFWMFWIICAAVVACMLGFFRKKGWLGK